MEKTFSAEVEERELPEASFTDLAVLFVCVSLAAGIDFSSMHGDAERAVGQATTFLQQLLDENARSDVADVQLLCKRKPELLKFLQEWLAPQLPLHRRTRRWRHGPKHCGPPTPHGAHLDRKGYRHKRRKCYGQVRETGASSFARIRACRVGS